MAIEKGGSSTSQKSIDLGPKKTVEPSTATSSAPAIKKDVPQQGVRDSRTSFVYMPENKRLGDVIKIQRRLGSINLFPYTFVVSTDVQFGLRAEIERNPTAGWEKERALFTACIDKINDLKPKPKFVVVLGNMCHSPPTGNNEYALRRNQEKDFFNTVDKLDEEIYFIPVSGERDLGELPTHSTVNRYRLSYGQEYFNFMVSGAHFVALASQYYVDDSHVSTFAEEQEKWLEEKLKEQTATPFGAIILMHKSPFLTNITEDDSNYNVPKKKRESLLKKLENGGVKHIFTGNLQSNVTASYNSMQIIATTAVSVPPSKQNQPGFRLVTVHPDKIEHTFVPVQTT